MVRIRLKRTGRTHRSCFRLTAVNQRASRDGDVLEELGLYDPANKNPELQLRVEKERIEYWLSKGAQPSDTVCQLLAKAGVGKPAAAAK